MSAGIRSFDAASVPADRRKPPAAFPDLFAEWVRRTPSAVAVRSDGATFTYAQLSAAAERMADYLLHIGVRGGIVAVFLDRSPDLVAALLAIGKAGAAFTVLDVASPPARLASILADVGTSLIITSTARAAGLPSEIAVPWVCVDALPAIADSRHAVAAPPMVADGLACVLYTSGSTGTPKGVMVDHASIAGHALHAREAYGIRPDDAAVLFAPPHFDAALEQIFSTLISGATLIVRPAQLWSAREFYQRMVECGVTIINPPVAYWRSIGRELARIGDVLPPHPLKVVVIGGDAMLPDDVRTWSRTPFLTHKLVHCYGPTETTVYVTSTNVPMRIDGTAWAHSIPIGRPVAGREVHVLDEAGEPVAQGATGELYIGGRALAWGYLNRPAETARSFVPDPFGSVPGARLYRTGDRGRRRDDGNFEFLGRRDHQVKVRGNRVDPSEVEQALRAFPRVSEAVVVGRDGPSGEKVLAAYLVCGGSQPEVKDVQQFLATRLPSYMLPAAYVCLDALPSSPEGKVDRRALPDPAEIPAPAHAAAQEDEAATGSDVERALTAIWKAVLGSPAVGRHDNFLEIGGDSILALRVVARANERGYALTYQDVFERQTIAELAQAVRASSEVRAADGADGPMLPTPIQLMFCERDLLKPHHYTQALMFTPLRPLDADLCRQTIGGLLEHHDALRLRLEGSGAAVALGHAPAGGPIPFEAVDLGALSELDRIREMQAHVDRSQRMLDLARGPICRVTLYSLGQSQRLFVVVHHLAIDTVSWRVLMEDFSRGYEQLRRGEGLAFARRTTSYKDWSRHLRVRAADPNVAQQVAYWEEGLSGSAAVLPAEKDGPNVAGSEEVVALELTQSETEALFSIMHHVSVAPSDVMIHALGRVLCAWAGAPRVLVDLESHGRDTRQMPGIDLSNTVGWFTAVYPVALYGGAEDPLEALARTSRMLAAVPSGGLDYAVLRYLAPSADVARRMRALPAAPVSFNYLGHWDVARSEQPLLKFAKNDTGRCIDEGERRQYVFDIGAVVVRKRLRILWTFSRNQYSLATVRGLADGHLTHMRRLIAAAGLPA